MEMESTRRSIDRSREPGAKKPRLVEDRGLNGAMDRERSYSSSRVPSGTGLPTTGQVPSRFKVNERERDVERNDSVRSNSVRGGVQLQQQQQTQPKPQQQNQELVSQYKTALAELTFNSKPIITNLTIIAGENLHVAKWIAATVCANILEVPSEQKLPSLYLLDSIVKNIGRDYIKYFAARLPEVFCKAYRQVDSSVHPGMRHLFGTWKSVFPPACLQMIEKELGFSPAANGSSSGAVASRSESQSQRPPHSIHVNPKYLEARQRNLQQSNRVKGVSANSGSSVPSDDDDAEKPDGNPMAGSERPWTELPIKGLKHPKREASSESLHEKNNVGYEDNEYSSDLSRNSDMGYARAGERVLEQDGCDKSWFGADINVPEATISQRNTFDNQRELSKYRDPRPGVAAQLLQKGPTQSVAQSGRVMNKNWKNSEEEEYMWDDMSSRYPKKERWTGDAEKMEIEDRLPQPHGEIDIGSRVHGDALADSLSSTHRGQTTFGHRTPSSWPPRESQSGDGSKPIGRTSRISGESEGHPSTLGGLSSGTGSLTRTGLRAPSGLSVGVTPTVESLLNTVSSAGILGQKRHQPQQAASPSRQSPMLLHPSSPSSSHRIHHESNNLTEDDRLQTRSSYLLGQSTAHHPLLPNRTYHAHPIKNSFPTISHTQSGVLQFQSIQSQPPQHMQNPSSSMQLSQRQHHGLFSMQSQPDLSTSRPSGEIQKQLPPSSVIGNPTKMGQSVLNHSSNPSMDIAGHSNASNMLATLIKSGVFSNSSVTSGFPNMGLQDSSTLTPQLSSRPPLPSGPPPIQLTSSAPTVPILDPLATQSLRSSGLPPLPPGPPPSSASGTPHTASVANTSGFPIDFILNSLVGKGLISAEKESPAHRSPQLPSQPQKQSPSLTISSLLQAPSNPSPQTMPTSSSGNDLSLPESPGSQATPTVSKDLIGTEFKADVIRQSHLSVISALHCLPHQCNICGLRLKYRERLDRHMEWHALKKLDTTSSRTSRRWYGNLGDWVHGSVRSASGPTTLCSAKGLVAGVDKSEPGVPADETQCVCVLCGELFEDFYSHERDEWMFKGAAYLPIPALGGEVPDEGPIVHKNCISPSSVYDLGLMKQEQMNG